MYCAVISHRHINQTTLQNETSSLNAEHPFLALASESIKRER